MTIQDKLGVDKFNTDELHSHIQVDKTYGDKEEIQRVIRVCPAGLYSLDDDGNLLFDHLGCLECGTCRVLSGGKVIKEWNYPAGEKGIAFRQG
ncbi:MAG: ferredoxin family protein [Hungatella sp.]|jgi:ferredoxin like protein|nr:ferredoxin family protein [Hungatella sp.]